MNVAKKIVISKTFRLPRSIITININIIYTEINFKKEKSRGFKVFLYAFIK